MDNINFKKVLDDGELFDQQANYEDNFEKINQEVVPKITDLETNKVDKVEGKGLSTNDFDNTYKQKIDIDIPAQLAETAQRIDDIITTPVPTGEIIAQEILDARHGKGSLGANITEVKSLLSDISDQGKANSTYYSNTKQPLVTFIDDDGSMEVYTRLYPILHEKGVTGNCAIITGSIGKNSFMTEGNLETLYNAGWEFLGHGHSYVSNLSEFTIDADLDYQLGQGCKGWLESRGYRVNGFVYPQGFSDARIRRFTRKHYDFAFQGEVFNTEKFLDTMRIKRIAFGSWTGTNPTVNGNSEKNTLAYYKACVDYAKANNIWLVFMLHVAQQPVEQDTILGQLLDYIKSQNVKIVNATDGYRTFGNKVFIGDVDSKYLAINEDGVFSSDIYPGKEIKMNSKNLTDGIVLYENGISIMKVNFSHGSTQGFPGNSSGTLFTYKIDNTYNFYNRQEFWQGTSNKKYVRYATGDATWSGWEEIITSATNPYKILGINAYNSSQPITDFPPNSITTFCVNFSGGAGFSPSQSAGIVTTYRIGGNGWDRQEFRRHGSNEVFSRYTDPSTGAWTAWAKISAV